MRQPLNMPARGKTPAAAAQSAPWAADLGDGTYRNPVLFADYSDPDVVRVGRDYYLVASSFNCTPALPILHSRDLVNWTIINHALKNLPHARYVQVQSGSGVWAPAIRHHAGRFWIFFPLVDEGIYVTTADDPRGRWSEPHLLQEGAGLIDPCPLWDEDGKACLVHAYAHSRCGIKHKLRVRPMAPDASRLLGEGKVVFDDPANHPTLEGPKFHKRNGYYYISAPAGGVATGWQLALRSRGVYGPYEPKVVLEQGSTACNGPHQGALVDTSAGEWWFVHFQERQPYGRVVHLQPVKWQDDWPLIGVDRDGNGVGEPVERFAKPKLGRTARVAVPQTSDEFTGTRLGLQWQWHANHEDAWHSLRARRGWLRLHARPAGATQRLDRLPHVLLQKLPAPTFTAETLVELNATHPTEAGLAVVGRNHWAALVVQSGAGAPRLVFRSSEGPGIHVKLGAPAARLRMEMSEGGECAFAYAVGAGRFRRVDVTFRAQEGHWIGAKMGVYCSDLSTSERGYADFDYFRVTPAARRRRRDAVRRAGQRTR
jgi:beta-xylosidase